MKFRGSPGEEPRLLNKTTGCESRTVPPLYVPMARSLTKVSHWIFPGRPSRRDVPSTASTSQKTYGTDLPASRAITGAVLVAEKRPRRLLGRRGINFLGGIYMKNKKIIIAVIAVVAVIALMLGVYFATRPQTQEGSKAVTVEIVHKDGKVNTVTCRTDEELLADLLVAEGILPAYDSTGMYSTVDGETASWEAEKSYWAFFVNGEYATEGMNTTPVEDGAVYRLEYTFG